MKQDDKALAREYGEEACAMVWDMCRIRPKQWAAILILAWCCAVDY